jgi:acyl-CoA oxidase
MVFIMMQLRDMNRKVRKSAVAYVDGFDFPDFILKAPVGRYDGNIYESYFDMVKDYGHFGESGTPSIASYWKTLVAPTLKSKPKTPTAKL